MKRPTVRQAHAICESVKAKAVIILALSDDQVAGASYGETQALCKQAGYTLDCIVDAIENGRIPVWTTEQSINSRRIREGVEEGLYCPRCQSPNSDCDCEGEFRFEQLGEYDG